jgi:tRNA A37 threonylcarbamoyladenosine modification protein TsaB
VIPPQPESEKNVIKKIAMKMKENFWQYYKEKKLEMIEEEEVSSQDNVSFFKDEHGGFEESS